jgi:hypothetical protein
MRGLMIVLALDPDDCECGSQPVFKNSIRGDKVFMFCLKCQHAGEHMKTPRGAVSRWNKMMRKFKSNGLGEG